jgi:O-antigen/teichoic acid export membrane protein
VLNGPLLAFFFDIRSAEANRLLILIAVAIAIRIFGTAFAASLYASKKFRSTLMIQGAATLIALAAALILIPAYGLIGAGLAIIAGAAIRTGALIILYVRSERRVAAAT